MRGCMMRGSKIVSMLVLVCFLFNTAMSDLAFSQVLNYRSIQDKLAPPSQVDDIVGMQPKDMGRIKFALEEELSRIFDKEKFIIAPPGQLLINTGFFISTLRNCCIKEKTIFQPADMQFFFNETNLTNAGLCVMVRLKDRYGARTYYATFSLQKDEYGGFPIKVYTEKQYADTDGFKKGTPQIKPEDAKEIERYIQHEKGIDTCLRYAHEQGLAKEPIPERFDYVRFVKRMLNENGIKVTNPGKLIPIEARKFYLVKLTKEIKDMIYANPAVVVDAKDREHAVLYFAHSSNNATHVFVAESAFEALTNADYSISKTDRGNYIYQLAVINVERELNCEIGAMLGLPITVDNDGIMRNELSRRSIATDNERKKFQAKPFELAIVNLDHVKGRDYAAGTGSVKVEIAEISVPGIKFTLPSKTTITIKATNAFSLVADLTHIGFMPADFSTTATAAKEILILTADSGLKRMSMDNLKEIEEALRTVLGSVKVETIEISAPAIKVTLPDGKTIETETTNAVSFADELNNNRKSMPNGFNAKFTDPDTVELFIGDKSVSRIHMLRAQPAEIEKALNKVFSSASASEKREQARLEVTTKFEEVKTEEPISSAGVSEEISAMVSLAPKNGVSAQPYFIGMSMGGTKLRAVLYKNENGKLSVIDEKEIKWYQFFQGKNITDPNSVSPDAILDQAVILINGLLGSDKLKYPITVRDLNNIGMTAPGPVNWQTGVIGAGRKLFNMPFENYPWTEKLKNKLPGLESAQVGHDSFTALKCEQSIGLLKGYPHGYYVIQGTGLGGNGDNVVIEATEPGHHIVRGTDGHYRFIWNGMENHPYEVVENPDLKKPYQITAKAAHDMLKLNTTGKLSRPDFIWRSEGEVDVEDYLSGTAIANTLKDKAFMARMFGGDEDHYRDINSPPDIDKLFANSPTDRARGLTIIKYFADEMGRAMACLLAASHGKEWQIDRIVIGSGVGENIGILNFGGKPQVLKEGYNDYYYAMVQQACYKELRDHFKMPEEFATKVSKEVIRSNITQDERETKGFYRTEEVAVAAQQEIPLMISLASEAGLQISTHPNERYNLLVTSEFFANGELIEHKAKYGDRFDLDTVSGATPEQFISNVLGKAGEKKIKTIALVPDYLSAEQLEILTKAGIRFVRVNTTDLLKARAERDTYREKFQVDTYVMMLLLRRMDNTITADSSIYRLLSFYLKTHFALTDKIAIDDYIMAIVNNDITKLIKGYLSYRPAQPYESPEYNKVAATLIAA
jgi:hypothetical protein